MADSIDPESTVNVQTLHLTAQIVAGYVRHHVVTAENLPALIKATHVALAGLSFSATEKEEKPVPAVPIRRSVFPDYIVCLEDGKKLKLLKRHLAAHYDMTPEAYRKRWGLPNDYPMVAPNYATHRAKLARELGLGRQVGPRASASGSDDNAGEMIITKVPERRRGRKPSPR